MHERRNRGCAPEELIAPSSLAEICQAYVDYRKCCCDDKPFYEQQPTLADAIAKAAMATRANGHRCSHHTRKPRALLETAMRRLLAIEPAIAEARDFDALIDVVGAALRGIKGLGPLYIYDTALRIGYRLRFLPQRVYLHAGTRAGAGALGLDIKRDTIPRNEFPPPLSSFDGAAIEDILCIYKGRFAPHSLRCG
jgi:hypothetical protein